MSVVKRTAAKSHQVAPLSLSPAAVLPDQTSIRKTWRYGHRDELTELAQQSAAASEPGPPSVSVTESLQLRPRARVQPEPRDIVREVAKAAALPARRLCANPAVTLAHTR